MHPAIKCTLVGDSGVGKTCLLVSYEYNGFPTNYIPHMGSPSSHIHLMIGEVLYMLDLFDTSGKADYDLLRPLSYPQSDVVLVCFSVGMPTSFENVRDKWFPEAHHFCPGVPCVIAATQIDLRDDDDVEPGKEKMRKPLITTAQGERLARELGAADYVECSAKTCKGMKDAFDVVVAAGIEYQSSLTKRKRKCIVV